MSKVKEHICRDHLKFTVQLKQDYTQVIKMKCYCDICKTPYLAVFLLEHLVKRDPDNE